MYEINKKMKLFPDIPEERRILYRKKEEENYNREYVNEEDCDEANKIQRIMKTGSAIRLAHAVFCL